MTALFSAVAGAWIYVRNDCAELSFDTDLGPAMLQDAVDETEGTSADPRLCGLG